MKDMTEGSVAGHIVRMSIPMALIAHASGRKDQPDANLVFNQSLGLAALCAVITLVAGYGLASVYMALLGADQATMQAGVLYLYWFLPGLALQFALISMGAALRGTGIIVPTIMVQVFTVALNALLAPMLIAGWLTGAPLGVMGASLATSISVAVGVILMVFYFRRLERYVGFELSLMFPRIGSWRRILAIGLPPGGEFALMFLYMAVIYWAIRGFGADAQAGFGIGSRVMQAIFLPAMAIAFATAPVAGQNMGAANEFKEGDLTLGVAAVNEESRQTAKVLLANTKVGDLEQHVLYQDALLDLIQKTTDPEPAERLRNWTMADLKTFVLNESEAAIKKIMPGLTSDTIACLVKLMSNQELIQVGQTVFNPLPNSQIGSKGYMSARVQPNSPTDNVDDIVWQVFDAWSFGVGDLVLGTNPVSSEPASVARIESALYDIITTFGLEKTLPNCVLSHIDVQAEVAETQPGTTGIWFQSLAGTVNANQTFDVTIEKMFSHAAKRDGQYGLYAETGQGADFSNGHGEGFDMVVHESRKYGFLRALKADMAANKAPDQIPWVHVNDVAGFIGPEVFKSREQLVRCCLEDTVMGKLHGLPIGLDICSTLHMDVTLEDLDWCIEQVMPANPAYLMALPTKNDPMLSYLTTAFNDHVKIREQFGYKVNDAMWAFFKALGVIAEDGKPTAHFGDPIWVYYQYRLAKNDQRAIEDIYAEGKKYIAEIRERGVPIATGYGENFWDLDPQLDQQVHRLYEDAKVSLWTEMTDTFVKTIPAPIAIATLSTDRKDYVYHPESGEQLAFKSIRTLKMVRDKWGRNVPDLQIVISDGLNPRALMDDGHLAPFLEGLRVALEEAGYSVGGENIVITHGRVRAGYLCGEVLFGQQGKPAVSKGLIHIIGERPGSGHHNFSAYLTVAPVTVWNQKGSVDHNISKVVSGISDTALQPVQAVKETVAIFDRMFAMAV